MNATVHRIRAGLYIVTDRFGNEWSVEERRVDPAWGGGWAWFATCPETGDALDPHPTLREAKEAIA